MSNLGQGNDLKKMCVLGAGVCQHVPRQACSRITTWKSLFYPLCHLSSGLGWGWTQINRLGKHLYLPSYLTGPRFTLTCHEGIKRTRIWQFMAYYRIKATAQGWLDCVWQQLWQRSPLERCKSMHEHVIRKSQITSWWTEFKTEKKNTPGTCL